MLFDANPMRYLCVYITLGFLALTLSAVCLFVSVCVRVFVRESVSVCVRACVCLLPMDKKFSGWQVVSVLVQSFQLILMDGILRAVKQTLAVYHTILDFCWFGWLAFS